MFAVYPMDIAMSRIAPGSPVYPAGAPLTGALEIDSNSTV
jgi:hypothetical protein